MALCILPLQSKVTCESVVESKGLLGLLSDPFPLAADSLRTLGFTLPPCSFC